MPLARGEHMTGAPSRSAKLPIRFAAARAPWPNQRAAGSSVSNAAHWSMTESGWTHRAAEPARSRHRVFHGRCLQSRGNRQMTNEPARARQSVGYAANDLRQRLDRFDHGRHVKQSAGCRQPNGIISLSVS